jgi:ferric-dicitrate binding protein FerR (iron transport regulator)
MMQGSGPPRPPDVPGTDEDDSLGHLLRLTGARPEATAERSARVRSAVSAHWRAQIRAARWKRRAVWAALSFAAATACIVLVGRGFFVPVRLPGARQPIATLLRVEGSVGVPGGGMLSSGQRLAAGGDLETGADGRAALELSDGSSLRLDAGTRVRLMPGPVLDLDRGAVYIDTGSGRPRRAFLEVRTKMALIRDIGTQFEVRLQGDELRLSVREGLTTLVRAGHSLAVPAGTRLLVRPGGAVEKGAVPLQGGDWDWVLAIAPAFDLEGRTLLEYLDWVSRETGWRVAFADPSLSRQASTIIVHGSVAGLRPDETPAAVLPTCGLSHRIADGTLFVERQGGARRPERP